MYTRLTTEIYFTEELTVYINFTEELMVYTNFTEKLTVYINFTKEALTVYTNFTEIELTANTNFTAEFTEKNYYVHSGHSVHRRQINLYSNHTADIQFTIIRPKTISTDYRK